jgi:glycerophosphoryl diester phosphodiesterase
MKAFAVLLAVACSIHSVAEAEEPVPFEIAHRGASGYLPEHTREAVVMAHGLGAAYIEQDVVLSADEVPVVLHDIHLDDVSDVATRFPGRARPDGKHYALDFTLAELKQLEMRERFKPATGERIFPNRYSGSGTVFRIVTLEESLRIIEGLNASTGREAGVYPEIKRPAWHLDQGKDISAVVLPILKRFGYEDKNDPCYLQCFEYDEVRRLREALGYRGRLIQLLGGGNKISEGNTDNSRFRSPEGLRELAKWVDGIGPPISEVVKGDDAATRRITPLAADARAAGLAVHPYTARADELPKWARDYDDLIGQLREAGVGGYFTDFPGLLRVQRSPE